MVYAALHCVIILIIVLEIDKLKGILQVDVMNYVAAESLSELCILMTSINPFLVFNYQSG